MVNKNIAMITRCAVFAAVLTVCSWVSVPMPFSLVPITLQTMAVLLIAVMLRPTETLYTTLVWILLGVIGLPVFSGFQSGIGTIMNYTGGFIIGFIPAAWLLSFILNSGQNPSEVRGKIDGIGYIKLIAGVLLSSVIIYLFGVPWFMYVLDKNLTEALTLSCLPYLPGDVIKAVVVIAAYPALARLRRYVIVHTRS
ncbi:MAG: biotin transporter BioY [Oscillospiraceae bacterium]|nr:biotin transporter BioY [Oscillospiraceae bacterium]